MARALARFSSRRRLLRSKVRNGGEGVRIRKISKWTPACLEAKLTAATTGTLESTIFPEQVPGYAGNEEKLRGDLFAEPSKWRDQRLNRFNPMFRDFKHKELSLNSEWKPPWGNAQLDSITPRAAKSSTFSWNQRLSRYAQAGQYGKTKELFQEIQEHSMATDKFTLLPVLKACARLRLLEHGRLVHKRIIQLGYESDLFIGSSLVDMYAKCGSIEDAERVFDRMPTRNVVTWNAMILGCVKCGEGQKALDIFEQMNLNKSTTPDPLTFVGVLKACAILGALEKGRRAHGEILRRGFSTDVLVGSCLVDMYAKCGSTKEAEKVFNWMPTRDLVAWTAMVVGYVQCGEGQSIEKAERLFNQMPKKDVPAYTAMIEGYVKCGKGRKASDLYRQMHRNGVVRSRSSFFGVQNACDRIASLEEGMHVHGEIFRRGYKSDVVRNSLVDMYITCGNIEEADRVLYHLERLQV